jgi:tetraacyldisaccharide 4'-kinase
MVDDQQRASIREQLQPYAPQADWLEASHAPQGFIAWPSTATDHRPPATDHRVLAFCGIGNPAGFRHTLTTCGCEVIELLEFPDHHNYFAADLAKIAAVAKRTNAAAIVCTQKDLVKINANHLDNVPLWALRIGLKISVGQEIIEKRLQSLVQSLRPNVA